MTEAPNAEMLTLARESRGMTQTELAAVTGISQGYISKAENGMQVMAPDKAATIAAALNYAPSILSCDDSVQGIDALFHRKLKSVPVSKLRQTQAEINVRRLQVRRLLKGIAIDAPNSFPRLDPEEVGGPEEVARLVRRAWRLPLGPIPDLARLLEAAGGVVVTMAFATDKVSAAAMWPHADERPMFFVNKNHNAERQRFSLAHELAHIVMHDVPAPELEEQADKFAAEFLMPQAEVKPQLTAHRLNLARLIDIKHYWKVSIAFVAKRAKDLGAVTERQARSLFQMLNARGYLKKEPFPIPAETPQTLDNALRLHVVDHSYSLNELGALAFLDGRGFAEAFEDFMAKLGGDAGRADRPHLRAVPST